MCGVGELPEILVYCSSRWDILHSVSSDEPKTLDFEGTLKGSLYLYSVGVTRQHLSYPLIIQCPLNELLQTDDGCKKENDSCYVIHRHRMRQQTLRIRVEIL